MQQLSHTFGTDNLYYEIDSEQDGPVVIVTANLHGDECTGIAVIQRLREQLPSILQMGKVYLFPSLNPSGLRRMTRSLPHESQDVNRVFPGDPFGDVVQRYIAVIWDVIHQLRPTLLIDLHTDSGHAFPYVLVDRSLQGNVDLLKQTWDLAQATELFVLWEYPVADYRRFNLQFSLAGSVLNQLEIPSLTMEIGPRRYLHPQSIYLMEDGIWRVLLFLNMIRQLDLEILGKLGHHIDFPLGVWRRASGPLTKEGGLVYPLAPLGKVIQRGGTLLQILNIVGEIVEVIWAEQPCVVLAYPDSGYIQKWNSTCTLAIAEGIAIQE